MLLQFSLQNKSSPQKNLSRDKRNESKSSDLTYTSDPRELKLLISNCTDSLSNFIPGGQRFQPDEHFTFVSHDSSMFTLTSDSDLVIGRYQKSGKRCSWFECPRCKDVTCHKSCQNRLRSQFMIEKRYSGLKNVKMLVKIFCKSPNVSAVLGIERQRKL